MNEPQKPFANPPIIEAVIDIDCDLPPSLELLKIRDAAAAALKDRYPKIRQQFIQQHELIANPETEPKVKMSKGPGAIQFLAEDEKQLVQFRPNGFSFNRLAPYSTLDDYLPDIECTWNTFCKLAKPVMIRKVGIRMINRILLPMPDGKLNFSDYLTIPPRLPQTGDSLGFAGFLEQQQAVDATTGFRANIVKTMELPKNEMLPLILDIDVFYPCHSSPENWTDLTANIQSLRDLKNRIFFNSLTKPCLNLFSQ